MPEISCQCKEGRQVVTIFGVRKIDMQVTLGVRGMHGGGNVTILNARKVREFHFLALIGYHFETFVQNQNIKTHTNMLCMETCKSF